MFKPTVVLLGALAVAAIFTPANAAGAWPWIAAAAILVMIAAISGVSRPRLPLAIETSAIATACIDGRPRFGFRG